MFCRCTLLALSLASTLPAQSLDIRVLDGDGAPLGLSSVIIRPAADAASTMRRLTAADGTVRHPAAAGSWIIVARHVGYRADSTSVQVTAAGGIPVTLRLSRIPQRLATMVVRESADCSLAGADIAPDESLWDEVVKGIEARTLLQQTYRYERAVHRVIRQDRSVGATTERVRDTVEVNLPAIRDTTAAQRSGTYTSKAGSTVNIRIFNETDLTDASFERLHCHGAPWRDTTDASVRIAFAPRRNARAADDAHLVRGVVILDGESWRVRGVTYEYVRDGKPVGQGAVDYSTLTVDDAPFALPTRIVGDLRLRGRFGLSSQTASWTITVTYSEFSRPAVMAPESR